MKSMRFARGILVAVALCGAASESWAMEEGGPPVSKYGDWHGHASVQPEIDPAPLPTETSGAEPSRPLYPELNGEGTTPAVTPNEPLYPNLNPKHSANGPDIDRNDNDPEIPECSFWSRLDKSTKWCVLGAPIVLAGVWLYGYTTWNEREWNLQALNQLDQITQRHEEHSVGTLFGGIASNLTMLSGDQKAILRLHIAEENWAGLHTYIQTCKNHLSRLVKGRTKLINRIRFGMRSDRNKLLQWWHRH